MRLTYRKVFDRYVITFSDRLAQISYLLYKTWRVRLSKIVPLSEHEEYRFAIDPFSKRESANMPRGFDYIANKSVRETKTQIDNILKLLNDAAEYRSSESNMKLQWIMMIITILSLIVALCSINHSTVLGEIKNLVEWIKMLILQ